jgi:plasmid stability protein
MTAKSITIRNVPEPVHRAWRVRAAKNGRSLEAELRAMLHALARPKRAAREKNPVDQSELTLTRDDHASGGDDAMRRVRDILRTEAAE